jgi:hypothetical protein
MVIRSAPSIYHSVLDTLYLWYNHGLARAFRIFCRCGLAGILIDLDHLPRILALFLGTGTTPPGRPFHKVLVIFSWAVSGALVPLYIGLLASGPTDDEIA